MTPPTGWYPSGAQAAFAPCEAFDRQPIAATGAEQAAQHIAIVVRSLGPVHYLVDPTIPPRTGERVVLEDTRLAAPVTAAGRPAARFEATSGAGWRSYTYLVDTGPTVLAAQYSAPPGQSARLYAAGKAALDQLVASLQLSVPGCLDSTDPKCGPFYTVEDPADAPIVVQLPALPVGARAGQPLTFEVTADDADADDLRLATVDSCVQIIDAIAESRRGLYAIVRSPPAAVDGRFGPWRSAPRSPGHATFTVSRTFLTPGQYSIYLSVRSANTAFPVMLDPYASYLECVEVKVAVR